MKNIIIALIIVALIGVGAYFYLNGSPETNTVNDNNSSNTVTPTPSPIATTTSQVNEDQMSIGKSAEGRDINVYTYGTGEKEVLFVGGIHGGYSWNTVLVAYELMDYLEKNPSVIPQGVKVTVIPVLNPDGLNKIVGTTSPFTKADVPTSISETIPGRFNSKGVDLNRNFDCEWKSSGTWQSKTVSGGTKAFSEPEATAVKNYVESKKPSAVVVYYSAAGGVFSSNCKEGVLPETLVLTNLYAEASGYRAYEDFNFYEITGDMVNWLAKIEVPAISVLLTNHADIEWTKNQSGITAILNHYAE